ncbi:hypothetical protein CDD80_4242 [Ophiocordyceps camponoti-rufipedis]|uniref:Uncharacterized protein n=1 Tax=Ophiocordyceps camponoti-rufipedis TaxID=2004952 RepID=A0A2C5YVP4_9HYPO|nr:hypothetical protein CDD80_4242 [Ophiocordyceps camponoti-rufipedis]
MSSVQHFRFCEQPEVVCCLRSVLSGLLSTQLTATATIAKPFADEASGRSSGAASQAEAGGYPRPISDIVTIELRRLVAGAEGRS